MVSKQIDVELCIAHADSARDAAIAAMEMYVSDKSIPCSDRFVVFSEAPGWIKKVISKDSLEGVAADLLPAGIPITLDHIGIIFDSIQTDDLLAELCEYIMDNMIGMVIE